jgi:HD-GYP domain-containing protein (c-di-GMP phosphodiesterase class II)
MQILFGQDSSEEIRERLCFLVESKFHARVREATSMSVALHLLEHSEYSIDLIILDPSLPDPEKKEEDFWAAAKGIPVIALTLKGKNPGFPETARLVAKLDRAKPMEPLIETIEKLIADNALQRADSDYGFLRIRTRLLLSMKTLKSDVFIRLSDKKFVKLFHGGDTFEQVDFDKYTGQKSVQYLFIKETECEEFVEKYNRELEKLVKAAPLSTSAALEVGDEAQETVQTLIKHFGFTHQVQQITKNQIAITLKAVGRNPRLSDILSKIKLNQGRYISSHSTMIAFVACGMAAAMKWDSEQTFYKLNMAAFLHDISLDNHELARIQDMQAMNDQKDQFTPDEYRSFKLHTLHSGELARRFQEIPPDCDTIIFQHHERPDGTGFPRGLTHTHIAPLTSVFIIAHDFVGEVFDNPSANLKDFIQANEARYSQGNFKKVARQLLAGI